jgi:hypothetical protein
MNLAAQAVGAADIVLMYGLALRLFRRHILAALAAVMLLIDPAHFVLSGSRGPDGVWVVPFVLGWLIALTAYLQTRQRYLLAVAAMVLAAGFYSQPAAPVLVLLLGVCTAAILLTFEHVSQRELRVPFIATVATLLPFVMWSALHPSGYADTFGRWLLHPAYIRHPLEWFRALSSWFSWTIWVTTWWDFFNPSFLVANPQAPAFAGVFLASVALLVGYGAYDLLTSGSDHESAPTRTVLVVAMMTAVIAAVTAASFKEPRAIQRALVVVPAGVLIGTHALDALWRRGSVAPRAVVAGALVAAGVQFALFLAPR